MNSAQRVLNQLPTGDGLADIANARLIFALAAESMAADDARRPFTSAISYIESVLPGRAANTLRTLFSADIDREALAR
jgi:hypothetical protein